jgi:hypothetical protein
MIENENRRFSVIRGLVAAMQAPILVWTIGFGSFALHCGLNTAIAAGNDAILFLTIAILPVVFVGGIFFAGGYLRWRLTIRIGLAITASAVFVGLLFGVLNSNVKCQIVF